MAKEADPEIRPETAEEQTFMDTLSRAYEHEAESRRLAAQVIKQSVTHFFTDHTPDGVMNSQATGAMLNAAARYNTTPEAAQSLFMAFSLRTAGGQTWMAPS